jgi:hypothetical protein
MLWPRAKRCVTDYPLAELSGRPVIQRAPVAAFPSLWRRRGLLGRDADENGSGGRKCRSGVCSKRAAEPHYRLHGHIVTTSYQPKRAPRKKRKQPAMVSAIVTPAKLRPRKGPMIRLKDQAKEPGDRYT